MTTTAPVPHVAAQLMKRGILTLSPGTPILDVERLLGDSAIHGAPVVDSGGYALGVISALDVLRATMNLDAQARDALTAADAMTRVLVTVGMTTPLTEVAHIMRQECVHRVLVTEHGRLMGIITSFDLLSLIAPDPPIRPAATDHDPST